jgi:DNA repair protein RecN (Recombination protein N)
MLLSLSIRDFVIVERLELEFRGGFTVLTGETGAGKSILIDALQFVLGERAAVDTIREASSRAEVAAEFDATAAAAAWLAAAGLHEGGEPAQAATILVRRTLDTAGRSRSFVNGSPATQAQMRELGALLLDVHGQHEHQLLLRPAAQAELLDRHAGLGETAAAVGAAFEAWRRAAQASGKAQDEHDRAAADSEQLRQTVEELERLAPKPGEWDGVAAEQKRLAHGTALLEGARAALDAIADAQDAMQPRLARLSSRLTALAGYDARLSAAVAALSGAEIQLEEAARELSQYLGSTETDEERLSQVEERIAALHAAGRKWRCAPTELPALLDASRARLDALSSGADLAALRAAEAAALDGYISAAAALTQARQAAAADMSRAVSAAMQELAMTGGRFEVRLVPSDPGPAGMERIEFLVAAHEGGTARPLARVASGGELSRIGLSIAVVAASANLVPTLIFDEVDAGVGGQVAATVGRLLRQLGRSRQVFCVTHLPQVASSADQHLAVRKRSQADGRPVSHTLDLSGDARVAEIARMLGGAQITALTQKHAREMLAGGA